MVVKMKNTQMQDFHLKLPRVLLAAIDNYAVRLGKGRMGERVGRAEAIRELLVRGLKQENER